MFSTDFCSLFLRQRITVFLVRNETELHYEAKVAMQLAIHTRNIFPFFKFVVIPCSKSELALLGNLSFLVPNPDRREVLQIAYPLSANIFGLLTYEEANFRDFLITQSTKLDPTVCLHCIHRGFILFVHFRSSLPCFCNVEFF